MKELKILTPVGMLGYGFPNEDFIGTQQHAPLLDIEIPI